MKRTESFDVDKTFDVACNITKAVTLPDGRRLIRGVASGILEDRDGERVSKRAIADMAMQPARGLKLVAGTHEQTWVNEIGDVSKMDVDPETDELIVDSVLPPEGQDPLADKAFRAMTVEGRKMGYSIGGKLTKCYYELAERGGRVLKRKVLDGIRLKHMVLTDTPSYAQSFVDVVAKTASEMQLDDSVGFHEEDDEQENRDAIALIEKAQKPPVDDAPGEQPEAPEGADAEAAADATPAAAAESPGAPDDSPEGAPEPPSDAEEAAQLPKAVRHLACPACGEEFAADLPDNDMPAPKPNDDAEPATAKTAEEKTMDPIAKLRELAEAAGTAEVSKTKTEPEAPAAAEEIAKTETETDLGDVVKMLAASHRHGEDRMDAIEAASTEGFEVVAKAVQKLSEQIAELPVGRRSLARVIPPAGEVEKTAADSDDPVEKAINDPSATALDVLKAQNAQRGIA